MSIKIGAENHPLFDEVQTALKVVTAEAVARETAVSEQSLTSSETWAAWQSKGLQGSQRLAECLEAIRAAKLRADGHVVEADAELAGVEAALRGWIAQAQNMSRLAKPEHRP